VHYSQSPQLPLHDHEVVLTFGDSPLPPFTNLILDTLAKECVKASFFVIGCQAAAVPDIARRAYNSGHVVGTHSQNHPLTFDQMSIDVAQREIDDGITSVARARWGRFFVFPAFYASPRSRTISARAPSWCGARMSMPTTDTKSRRRRTS